MKRVVITVKGEVQRVGYRDFVERVARKLKINGFVENLKPHDVRIVCESDEKSIISFLEQINIKKFPISVEGIEVMYEEPSKKFEWFEIRRGEPMEEIGERMDFAGSFLFETRDLQKETLGLQKETLGAVRETVSLQKETLGLQKETLSGVRETVSGINNVANKIDSIDNGIKGVSHKIDSIDIKYGKIAENMEKIFLEMKEERKDFREGLEKLVKAILEKK